MKNLTRNLIFAALLVVGLQAHATAPVCATVHAKKAQAETARYIERDSLVGALIAAKLPAVAIPTSKGPIPAILMNAETGPRLKHLMDRSLGTVVNYQPEYNNDHGMIRLFGTLADMDTPGARRSGELHQTGISWMSVDNYLQYAQGRSRVKVEVVYSLTSEESRTAMTYHLMRRAAIIRVPFTFGGQNRQVGLMNMLERSGEHCFIFCSGSGVPGQIQEMRQKIAKYELGTADEIMAREDVKSWLDAVEAGLLKVSPDDPRGLNNTLPLRVGIPESLEPATSQMTPEQRAELLNWIAGYGISQKYVSLTKTLGIQGDNAYRGIENSRAVAIFIYDGVSKPEQFMSPEYKADGKFSNWTHQNAKTLEEAFPKGVEVAEQLKAQAATAKQQQQQRPVEQPQIVSPPRQGLFKTILNFFR